MLKRGGIAKSKNPEIKVTNYIPPQIFNRYRAAQEYVAELRESSEEGMYTVRVSKTDVRILFKKEINVVWEEVTIPSNLPEFDNNCLWEGLTPSRNRGFLTS